MSCRFQVNIFGSNIRDTFWGQVFVQTAARDNIEITNMIECMVLVVEVKLSFIVPVKYYLHFL